VKTPWLIGILLLSCLLCGCPAREKTTETASAPPAATSQKTVDSGAEGAPADQAGADSAPELGPPKQLILIYSGHTLSRPDMVTDFNPPEGGLSALTATILDYESQIVDYNRLRVLNAGGDAENIRTDLARGMLGDHPFMLLDYGCWSRPNDFLGDIYVGLYFRMFSAIKYTAVGCTLYDRLPPERWQAYLEQWPEDFKLLVSAGSPQAEGIPATRIVTREIHGARWGVAAVPLPPKDSDVPAVLADYVNEAATLLADAECAYTILLLADGPSATYKELAGDERFSLVIGAPPSRGVVEGYGEMPTSGALLLPQVDANGRQIGVCHLYYAESGDRPVQYYFSRKVCIDRPQDPLPFRQQVADAVAEHQARYDEWAAQQQAAQQ